jgi:NAD(P)-dependent dehydrogenase (short-subunit alcohol dehydrogenase family)
MEILVVVGTLSGQGGIETCVQSLAREAEAHGDHVRVLALSPSTVDGRWHEKLDYDEVSFGPKSLKWQTIWGVPALVRAFRRQRPDVVIADLQLYGAFRAACTVPCRAEEAGDDVAAFFRRTQAAKEFASLCAWSYLY